MKRLSPNLNPHPQVCVLHRTREEIFCARVIYELNKLEQNADKKGRLNLANNFHIMMIIDLFLLSLVVGTVFLFICLVYIMMREEWNS